MLKKILSILPVLLLAGCTTTFTRLTPLEQPRNPNNLYPVEVQFNSTQQAMRWDSLKPYVIVSGSLYPLRPVPLVENRWEGYVPLAPTASEVNFRFKFEYLYNDFGATPKPDSAWSPQYTLKVIDQ